MSYLSDFTEELCSSTALAEYERRFDIGHPFPHMYINNPIGYVRKYLWSRPEAAHVILYCCLPGTQWAKKHRKPRDPNYVAVV